MARTTQKDLTVIVRDDSTFEISAVSEDGRAWLDECLSAEGSVVLQSEEEFHAAVEAAKDELITIQYL